MRFGNAEPEKNESYFLSARGPTLDRLFRQGFVVRLGFLS